jgi:hypothetical protein
MTLGVSRWRQGGQAAIEAVALVPVLLLAVLAAWQLVAIGVAALHADAQIRREGMSGGVQDSSAIGDLRARVEVPALMPAVGGMSVVARGAVRSR